QRPHLYQGSRRRLGAGAAGKVWKPERAEPCCSKGRPGRRQVTRLRRNSASPGSQIAETPPFTKSEGWGHLRLQREPSYPFFNSTRTCRATSFSVSNTPLPSKATASKTDSLFLFSSRLRSSIGMAEGRSRLFNCST